MTTTKIDSKSCTPSGPVPVEAGLSPMVPLYTPINTSPAYQLNWGLTIFWRTAAIPEQTWLASLKQTVESDGVRLLQHRLTTRGASQFFLSSKPQLAPSEIIRSVKGRLQHLLRSQCPKAFRRNYAIHSVGDAKRSVVEQYVAGQLDHHPMIDSRVQQMLTQYQRSHAEVDLSQPSFSSHGEFWHNLHLVIVNESRWMEIRQQVLSKLTCMIERVTAKHGIRLSRMAILPDHIHLTLGCAVNWSPEAIAMTFLNNCAYACGMKPVFKFSYYVGTIGEYDRGAIH